MIEGNTAQKEMERLRHAVAWSPLFNVVSKKRNQYCTKLAFEDGSILGIYTNGDASWFFRDTRGQTCGEQRWRDWHYCNATGVR